MKKIALAVLLFAGVSLNAFAADVTVNIDGKNIVVTDTTSIGSDKEFLDPSKFEKGIYVMAVADTIATRYPNAEKIIAERLAIQGFKIADSLENSSAAIVFRTNGALNLADADKAAANSYLPNGQQLASGAGVAITAISLGIPGIVGSIAGLVFQTDSNLVVTGQFHANPIFHEGVFANSIQSKDKDGSKDGLLKVYYNLESGKEASDDIVLKMAADQWIVRFMKKQQVVAAK